LKGVFVKKEFDACGVGFICDLKNRQSHYVIELGLEAVKNLTHRGAIGADGKSGDGCGLLFEIPERFFKQWLAEQGRILKDNEQLGCGVLFLSDDFDVKFVKDVFDSLKITNEIFVRDVEINIDALGEQALKSLPKIVQIIFPFTGDKDEVELKLFLASMVLENKFPNIHVASMSTYNLVYKGMLSAPKLDEFYPDLTKQEFVSRYAIFHQRYSTNTAPSWRLAQPFGMLAHNGEINTITANRNNLRAMETLLSVVNKKEVDIKAVIPLVNNDESDSASLDKALKLLILSGYSPELAINLLIPPAWEELPFVNTALRAFFQYNEMIMEPWDGPAAVVFTDGKTVCAHLDRNGLRPLRYTIYEEGLLVAGSETGIASVNSPVIKRGKLGSGDTLSVKLTTGRVRNRMEILNELAVMIDFQDKLRNHAFIINKKNNNNAINVNLSACQIAFGYTEEDLKEVIPNAVNTGNELIFSMGNDTPLPIFSKNPQLLFNYFKQRFAQVTNPPIDPIREKCLTSLTVYLGAKGNLLNYLDEKHPTKIVLPSPVLTTHEIQTIKKQKKLKVKEISTVYNKDERLEAALQLFESTIHDACQEDVEIIIISDADYTTGKKFIPSLLALSAAVRVLKSRNSLKKISIVLESGEVKNSHHLAMLLSFGASAVHPWLAFSVANSIKDNGFINVRKALEEGLRKIMSKMGISCVSSYINSYLFEALCLDKEFADKYFPDVPLYLYGHNLDDIDKNYTYFADLAEKTSQVPCGGDLKFKKDGELHAWSPLLLKKLNQFLKEKDFQFYREYAEVADNYHTFFIRHLFDLPNGRSIPLEQVETEETIVKRFFTGGMSLGALSPEAHEVIIEACNRLGMRCNSGEGGEDPKRYNTEKGSSIKQVASGRFGVTPDYLASAKEIEIKLAQGAKPGEGGQLPGHKVTPYIAYLRYGQTGVTLISPPPHHDIYSIEDLAQLINDLKHANPEARIGVKLVSETGIGQIASGAVKAFADFIQISSTEGGTGASSYVSIKHAGNYWEVGLSEVHLTLVENGLRERVTIRVDGGFKTGRDIIIAALLGAEEFGFGTAAMLAEGCIMARQCHKNTCPTGIATQDPELRKRFRGKVEDVMAFFMAIARDVREKLAMMGYRRLEEIIGAAKLLKVKENIPSQTKKWLEDLLKRYNESHITHCKIYRNEPINDELNKAICEDVIPYLKDNKPFIKVYKIRNTDRSVPVRLNYFISKYRKDKFLPDDTIKLLFEGVAGQSFGAFNHRGLTIELIGEANDYVGKGMFGGMIIIKPVEDRNLKTYKNFIVGNTALYGATGGKVFIAGMVGERFAIRNSGAFAVIEGAGHHLCEYMTGGVVVSIGTVGLNVGAGMTGGLIYVFDEADNLEKRINTDYVFLKPLEMGDLKMVQRMLNEHYYYTHSQRAKEILESFDTYSLKFKKVVPKEQAVVLKEKKGELL
jgi:glutamate synthase (NADPH/NADH) large chain